MHRIKHTRCSDFWTWKQMELKEKWEWRGFGIFTICILPIAISKWSTSMPSSQCHGHNRTYVTFASNTWTCNCESHTVINTNDWESKLLCIPRSLSNKYYYRKHHWKSIPLLCEFVQIVGVPIHFQCVWLVCIESIVWNHLIVFVAGSCVCAWSRALLNKG